VNFGIIIIGDEILSGRRQDKHLAHTIALFGARGLQLAYADYVGDDPARITATLQRAFASGDVVFSFGGIGATPDDHTRQCAAAALQTSLVLHPQAKLLIQERMQDVAREKGLPYEPERDDNQHRLNMGCFPIGAGIIPNPYNKIPGFYLPSDGGGHPHAVGERGGVYFVPGFPVMAWPMVEWVLDQFYQPWFRQHAWQERSVIVFGAMEATLTPLMERIEQVHAVKVFSLPSVDHPEYGRHIDLGVKGAPAAVGPAFAELVAALQAMQIPLGPEMVRN
jgi:molybdopterin-biosynthesis enzyme MoeA-like protein